tara:strand:- start:259 stop:1644 length:1386 start_codon:yes stop_codon:yes gene_type:complete
MRSGNLPARYEVNTIPPSVYAATTITNSASVIYTTQALEKFPPTGTLRIRQTTGTTTANSEYINYTNKFSYEQDVISVDAGNDSIEVADTTGLANGQPIVFNVPFSNIVANKTYYVATVFSSTRFSINTTGSATGQALVSAVGNALSPLATASAGYFSGVTREQAGNTTAQALTISAGQSNGTVSSGTGIQVGQRVIGDGIPSGTAVYAISGNNIHLTQAATSTNPSSVKFPPMSNGAATAFTYSATQPIVLELLEASSIPQISHWGSSVIMEGLYDDDRAYVYTAATKQQRGITGGQTRSILALRVAPSVDNGITGDFGARELINRMQLVLRQVDISSNGKFFVELVLNPNIDISANWIPVGGTSLAQYAVLDNNSSLVGGETIFAFYSDNGVNQYSLKDVKEISNSILGGGFSNFAATSAPNPTGVFPDGPEVLAIRARNLTGGSKNIDARFSWTEAQA